MHYLRVGTSQSMVAYILSKTVHRLRVGTPRIHQNHLSVVQNQASLENAKMVYEVDFRVFFSTIDDIVGSQHAFFATEETFGNQSTKYNRM